MITQTGGFGLSASRGRTLTIAKLGRAGGLTAWSGPAYGTCHSAGLGLTFGEKAGGGGGGGGRRPGRGPRAAAARPARPAPTAAATLRLLHHPPPNAPTLYIHPSGYDVIQTIVVLGTDAAVADAARGGPRVGVEVDLIAGREREVSQSDPDGSPAVPFSVAGGVMLDVSLKGGAARAAARKNAAVYGRPVGPATILAGGVDHPLEFEPLYELLSALAREHEEFQA